MLFLPGLEAIFVEQHLHVVLPVSPCLLADVLVDSLPEGAVKGRFVEAFGFAS
jgi:hypothetical protein